MNIKSIKKFNFEDINLGNLQTIQGGSYFVRIFDSSSSDITVQLPKCNTKQGIISTKKNKYCDLMCDRNKSEVLISWIEKLEERIIKIISEKKNNWFHNELTEDDITTMLNPISRSFKSGKNILIRTIIDCNKHTGKSKCIAYDEKENIIEIETIDSNNEIIPLISLEGIRFNSRNFEMDIKLKQFMILDNLMLQNKCLIMRDNLEENKESMIEISPVNESLVKEENLENLETSVIKNCDEYLVKEEGKEEGKEEIVEVLPDIENHVTELLVEENKLEILEEDEMNSGDLGLNKDKPETLVKKEVEEVTLNFDDNLDEFKIREPSEIYYEIYKTAKNKAKQLKHNAMNAYLEAKQIKRRYMLDDSDSSDEENEVHVQND